MAEASENTKQRSESDTRPAGPIGVFQQLEVEHAGENEGIEIAHVVWGEYERAIPGQPPPTRHAEPEGRVDEQPVQSMQAAGRDSLQRPERRQPPLLLLAKYLVRIVQ